MKLGKSKNKSKAAKLIIDNKTYILPIYNSTEGESVIDISKLHWTYLCQCFLRSSRHNIIFNKKEF